jgi:hypothetical protein
MVHFSLPNWMYDLFATPPCAPAGASGEQGGSDQAAMKILVMAHRESPHDRNNSFPTISKRNTKKAPPAHYFYPWQLLI